MANRYASYRWIRCKCCKNNMIRIERDTEATQLPVYCRKCKNSFKVNIRPNFDVEYCD
jgi:hypothetical protein